MITIEQAQRHYGENDSAHGFDHVLRVLRLAERIGRAEGADLEVVRAAALLHDVGRAEERRSGTCHAAEGARRARALLQGHPAERVEAVAAAIASHRFRGEGKPLSLEAQVLYDADKLDAIGAVGIARAYALAGCQGQRLWADAPPDYATRAPGEGRTDLESTQHTPVHEFAFKLSRLCEGMYTATGKRLAAERHRYMVAFFERLGREVRGEA